MGPQSQRRNTLQQMTFQLAAAAKKKRKTGQQITHGEDAFDPIKDCRVCEGKLAGRTIERAHHKFCTNGRRTRGITSSVTPQQNKIDAVLKKHFNAPLP